jgi:two-component system, chemotaxis family, sensor kinase CheA
MADLIFDISQDELPIYLAETDEHLQELDEALVRLERLENDEELLQSAFRAAHTLKGMAGMIGHTRMVDLTHMLETAFDSMRKKSLAITTPLIDLCLKAVDGLRVLNQEIHTCQSANLDLDWYAINFSTFIHTGWMETLVSNLPSQKEKVGMTLVVGGSDLTDPALTPAKTDWAAGNGDHPAWLIEAHIAANSIASAARAFQLMMALQEFGEILRMEPTAEQIDTSLPVPVFRALVSTEKSQADLLAALDHISEIECILLDGKVVYQDAKQAALAQPEQPALAEPDRLGEYLLNEGLINQTQLDQALAYQQQHKDKHYLLGKILEMQGTISPEKLNQSITRLVQNARGVPQTKTAADRGLDKTVRTSVERLDNLMNLVGELITDRNRLTQVYNNLNSNSAKNEGLGGLSDTVSHLGRITDQLQEEVMRIRMLPIANVFNKFPRLVRDLAQKTGKDIDLVIKGQDTELDRSVMEEINDPLIHLIRNSVDHGIESPEARRAAGKPARGTVRLAASHEQNHIILTIEDDGNGIDANRIRSSAVQKGLIAEADAAKLTDEKAIDLIFLSGLSTTDRVTELSGRGVGMDIVRNNIQRINGTVQVETVPGQGTRFQINLPLTLAIVPTLLVRVCATAFAIPLVTVLETHRLPVKSIQKIQGKPAINLRDQVLPLVFMRDAFNLPPNQDESGYLYIVVVRSGKLQAGLVVDRLVGEEEVVVKSLGSLVKNIPGISSAAILGDGQVALIIDVPSLFKFLKVHI